MFIQDEIKREHFSFDGLKRKSGHNWCVCEDNFSVLCLFSVSKCKDLDLRCIYWLLENDIRNTSVRQHFQASLNDGATNIPSSS